MTEQPRAVVSQTNQVILSEVRGDRYHEPKLPEHACAVCGAPAGRWCLVLMGGSGWQHADRPRSSWEPVK